MLKRLVTIAVALAAVLGGCGIPDHGQVSTIQGKDLRQLGDTIPPTSTSTTPPSTLDPTTTTTTAIDTASTIATEDVTVYFISGGQLKGYPRTLARPATTSTVLSALQEGKPPGDAGVGIRSAVPTRDQSLLGVTDDASGVATIHLPQGFFEQIPPEDQLLATGQLVLTITEVRGIGQVLFVQDGQPRGVPRGSGGITDGTEPLARRDYQDLLNTAPTTTTTTVPPVVPVDTTIV